MASRAPGFALRGWLALTWALQPLLPWHLKRRTKRGKEDATRWREKLGHASANRPDGKLIWMHAVGLGEVLALRGLIARLSDKNPDLHFLVTSGTLASARVFARNLPPRTIHQFAPLDTPGPARRFLQHWHPDLSVWAEQELWPGLVYRTNRAGIPLALVNARMNAAAFERRRRGGAIYRDILPRFALISAQDDLTAEHLTALGAPLVSTDGSLKPVTPPLADAPEERATLETALNGRFCWMAASCHASDEDLTLTTHQRYLATNPGALLILSPRLPDRAPQIMARLSDMGLKTAQRSKNQPITPETQVYLADTFGDLGLFYRLASAAFIGGTTSDVEGHNPWEAAQLGCAILHGPRTANFSTDYAALQAAEAAQLADTPDKLLTALTDPSLAETATRARSLVAANMDRLDHLCQKLRELL